MFTLSVHLAVFSFDSPSQNVSSFGKVQHNLRIDLSLNITRNTMYENAPFCKRELV